MSQTTKIFYFFDIDCAACASKIEGLLNKNENIDEARVSFINKKIIVTYHDVENINELVLKIMHKVEPTSMLFDTLEEAEHYELDHEEKECECCHSDHDHCHEHEDNHEHCHDHKHNHEHCHEHEHNHEYCHDHEHNHEEKIEHKQIKKHSKRNKINILNIIGVVLAIVIFVMDKIVKFNEISIILRIGYIIAYLLIAYKIIIKALKGILHGNIFNENFLMLVASIGALIINESLEAILVVLLYSIGEYFEDKAIGSSTDAIASLTKLKVEKTCLENGELVDTNKVKVGDIILVKVGERISLDGELISGHTSLDMKALTGESMPVDVETGDIVLSGSINLTGVISIRVTKTSNESTANKIIEMVKEASDKKSHTEEFISKFAKVYTPIVLILALMVFLIEWLLIDKFTVNESLNNCFVFLVTSCPCALVISIPLAFFGGIGKCSQYGILVKGGNYIEALSKVKTICFDKTGTLTKGNFVIKEINAVDIDEDELVDYISSIEAYSNHPIACAITKFRKANEHIVEDVKEVPGQGLIAKIDSKVILVGNAKLMKSNKIVYEEEICPGSAIYCALDNKFIGNILVIDEIKKEVPQMIKVLKELNIKTWIISGDKENIVKEVTNKLDIDNCAYELLPNEKLDTLSSIINEDKNVAYVGDGINDTPSLKLADVGIAVGGFGHDEAIASSDIVLMSDDMSNLTKAIKISKYTKKILLENIIFALSVKLIALVIGTLGILQSYGMLLGVFADVGVCLIAILNTLRILKYRGK